MNTITLQTETVKSREMWIFWLMLVPAGMVAAMLYVAGFKEVALGIVAASFIACSVMAPEIGFYGYFAWQSLDPMMIVEETTILTPGKLLGLFLIANYVIGIWRNRTPMHISRRYVMIMMAFGLYGIILTPVAVNPMFAFRNAAQVLIQVILVVIAIHTLKTREAIGRAAMFLVIGGVIASLIMLESGGLLGGYRRGTLSRYANPNTSALGLSLAVMGIPVAWSCLKSRWYIPLYLLAAPIIIAATMQTGSRSALAAILLASVMGGFLASKAGVVRRIGIPLLCILIALVTGAYVLATNTGNHAGLERIESMFYTQGGLQTESRWYIWKMVINTYLRQPWGFGFGNTQFKMAEIGNLPYDIHSTVLSTLVDGGPVTFFLFLYGFWLLIKHTRNIGRANPGTAAMMLLCFVGLSCLTHTIHFTKWFWIPVTFCLLLAELTQRENMNRLHGSRHTTPQPPARNETSKIDNHVPQTA